MLFEVYLIRVCGWSRGITRLAVMAEQNGNVKLYLYPESAMLSHVLKFFELKNIREGPSINKI